MTFLHTLHPVRSFSFIYLFDEFRVYNVSTHKLGDRLNSAVHSASSILPYSSMLRTRANLIKLCTACDFTTHDLSMSSVLSIAVVVIINLYQ